MSATLTHDLPETDAPKAPPSGGITSASVLMIVVAIILPLFGMIGGSLVARSARNAGASSRFPDLVVFWAAILFYVETLIVFALALGSLGGH